MLPDTELLCDLRDGLTLCDASTWHYVFLAQSILVVSLGLVNVGLGARYVTGTLTTPLWLARRFTWATLTAAVVPLITGLGLLAQVRQASYACYLQHATTGCSHSLLDRGHEMAAVLNWIGWTEGLLVGTCVLGLALLHGRSRETG
jgi:hypothetical protein